MKPILSSLQIHLYNLISRLDDMAPSDNAYEGRFLSSSAEAAVPVPKSTLGSERPASTAMTQGPTASDVEYDVADLESEDAILFSKRSMDTAVASSSDKRAQTT